MSLSSRSSAPSAPRLRVSGPAELVEAIPYLFGFHPRDSVALVGLRAGRVEVAGRLDLVDAVPALLHHTLQALRRGGVTEVVAILYADVEPPPAGELPLTDLVADIGEAVVAHDGELIDAVLVAGGRYWSYLCDDVDCCPRTGTPLTPGASAVAAEATFAGLVALPERRDLERLLEPRPDVDSMRGALDACEAAGVSAVLAGRGPSRRRADKRALFAAARAWTTETAGTDGAAGTLDGTRPALDDDELARLGVALTDIAVRDAVWLAIDNRRLDGRPLWAEMARRLPSTYAAPPLFLFGWTSWRHGDGTLAGIAAERAARADPAYTAAELLTAAVTRALDPRRTPRLRMPRPA